MSLTRRKKRLEKKFDAEKNLLDELFSKLVNEFLSNMPSDEDERVKQFEKYEKKWKDAVWSMTTIQPREKTLRKFNDFIYDALAQNPDAVTK